MKNPIRFNSSSPILRVIYLFLFFIFLTENLISQCNVIRVTSNEEFSLLLEEINNCTKVRNIVFEGDKVNLIDFSLIQPPIEAVIFKNTSLEEIDFTGKAIGTSTIIVEDNQSLKTLKVDSIVRYDDYSGNFHLFNNRSLEEVTIDRFTLSEFAVFNNDLAQINIALPSITRDAEVSGTFSLNGLIFVEDWFITWDKYSSITEIENHFAFDNLLNFSVFDTYRFSMDGLQGINSIENLYFGGIDSLDLSAMEIYPKSYDIIGFDQCTDVIDFSDLAGLNTTKNLRLTRCPIIKNIDGVVFKDTLNNIFISDNPRLTSIGALSTIAHTGSNSSLTIQDNELLAWCNHDIVCDMVTNYPDRTNISGNVGSCLDKDEVARVCLTSIEQESNFLHVSVHPTVFSKMIELQVDDDWIGGKLQIYDVQGRLVKALGRINSRITRIDLNSLSSGTYYLNVNKGQLVKRLQLVKL